MHAKIMHTHAYENNTKHRLSNFRKSVSLNWCKRKTSLVRLGLEALIARESSKRLAMLGGTEKEVRKIPRRRSEKSK